MQAERDAGRDLFTCERFFREKYIDPDRAIAIAEFAPYWIKRAVEAEKDAERLRKEQEKLVESLRYYANPQNYEGPAFTGGHDELGETYHSWIDRDHGQRARDTLKALGLE